MILKFTIKITGYYMALKLIIRQRKNSLFYHNDFSAYVGSLLTSLIATCIQAGVNAMDYFVALQDNRSAVFANPANARMVSRRFPHSRIQPVQQNDRKIYKVLVGNFSNYETALGHMDQIRLRGFDKAFIVISP